MHPDQLPWKRTEAVEEEEQLEVGGFDVGYVEVSQGRWRPRSKLVENKIETKNRFQALTTEEQDYEIGAIEIETPDEPIEAIGVDRTSLRSAGYGKITVDSGAAESVLPVNVVPNEKLIEGGGQEERREVCCREWGKDGESG